MTIKILHLCNLTIKNIIVFFSTISFKIKLLLRHCKYGADLKISGKVFIASQENHSIKIGNNFKLNSNFGSNLVGLTNQAIFQTLKKGKIIIGNNCGFSSTVLSSRSKIIIGNYVKIGANCRIYDHDYHSVNYLDRRTKHLDIENCKTAEVIIEDDVFIGTNVIILKGTKVGARSIIGAGSVVFGLNIPPDSKVVGNPAQIIRN